MLAPLALGLFVVVFFAIVLTAGSGDGGSEETKSANTSASKTTTSSKKQRTNTTTTKQAQSATYTVKVGDTLGSISETTGVPVQKLLDLNPDLDPQALVSGQKIKLRE